MYMIHPDGIENGVIRLSDKAYVPACPGNRDWEEYLEWIAEDNEPLEWQENYGE